MVDVVVSLVEGTIVWSTLGSKKWTRPGTLIAGTFEGAEEKRRGGQPAHPRHGISGTSGFAGAITQEDGLLLYYQYGYGPDMYGASVRSRSSVLFPGASGGNTFTM